MRRAHDLGGRIFARAPLTAFIAFHGIAMACWAVPIDVYPVQAIKSAVGSYFRWCGLSETWSMFSPDPPRNNRYLDAEVTFKSGRSRIWSFPRIERLGLFERYPKERYRKFENDWLARNKHARLWPDASRYIARQLADPSDPPRLVKLIKHSAEIPELGSRQIGSQWRSSVLFTYQVTNGDLR